MTYSARGRFERIAVTERTSVGASGPNLSDWMRCQPLRSRGSRRRGAGNLLRFAFYRRASTAIFQEPASSRRWQRGVANELVAGYGQIVVEFFDVGCSRRVEWADRPRAAALLAAMADPDRGFDAVVVGEYERAFAAASSRAWHRYSSGTAWRCGCPSSTDRSTTATTPTKR